MNDRMIFTIAYFDIHQGKTEEFKRLAAECVEIVKAKEPGTLFYEWFLDDEEKVCMAIDCYVDFDALNTHVDNIGARMRQLMTISDRRVEVYGDNPFGRLAGKGTSNSKDFRAKRLVGKLS